MCPGCKRAIATPVGGGPGVFATPAAKSKMPLVVLAIVLPVVVLGVLACAGVLVGMLMPAVQSAREAARKAACTNNLRQIAGHAAIRGGSRNPAAGLSARQERPAHAQLRVLILPQLGLDDLYKLYDFNEPWDGPHNRLLANNMPPMYRCPSSGQITGGITSYAVMVGDKTAFPPGHGVRLQDISDGLSNTLMVVEADGAQIPWMEPRDLAEADMSMKIVGGEARGAEDDGTGGKSISSRHLHGANAVTCNGAVHFLQSDLDPQTLRNLIGATTDTRSRSRRAGPLGTCKGETRRGTAAWQRRHGGPNGQRRCRPAPHLRPPFFGRKNKQAPQGGGGSPRFFAYGAKAV